MMIHDSQFSKGLTICIVYNIIIILTVTCNYTLSAAVGNNVAIENDSAVSGQSDLQIKEKEIKFLPERAHVVDGENTDDGTKIAQIKDSIQLGIQYAVNSVDSKPKRYLYPKDFEDFEITAFQNLIDNNHTPALYHRKFTFTTYAPIVFRYFRELFEIQCDNYLDSFYNSPLIKLSDTGASTSTFYLTRDDKFIMKFLQSTKFQLIHQLLPKYCEFMQKNPSTLLPTFSGLYGYKTNQIDIKLVSINNLLPSNIKMHLKFNLKGSTYKRTASNNERLKPSPTFKDLDFNDDLDGIFLMPDTRLAFLKTLKSDCDFLESINIINYSLLMGVHKIDEDMSSTCSQAASARWNRLMAYSIGMESIQADTGTYLDENCSLLKGSIPAKSESGERLLLFVGIIDILQIYTPMKKGEKTLKTIIIEGTPGFPQEFSSISVQPPRVYASRFMEYMTKSVFKPIST